MKFGPPEEAEDQDLEVVEMGEQDDEVPFVFAIPRGRVATFTGEEDDDGEEEVEAEVEEDEEEEELFLPFAIRSICFNNAS